MVGGGALAFLEAQCWKEELGSMARLPAADAPNPLASPAPVAAKAAAKGRSWRQHLATPLTLGACFLIALSLGMMLRGWSGGGTRSPGSTTVQEAKDSFPLPTPPQTPAAQSPDDWEVVGALRFAQWPRPDGAVPAVHRDAFDQNMMEQVPEPMPPEVRRAFEQSGYQVMQQREIVPVPMNDRRLMVPVDHVEVHYVGRGSL